MSWIKFNDRIHYDQKRKHLLTVSAKLSPFLKSVIRGVYHRDSRTKAIIFILMFVKHILQVNMWTNPFPSFSTKLSPKHRPYKNWQCALSQQLHRINHHKKTKSPPRNKYPEYSQSPTQWFWSRPGRTLKRAYKYRASSLLLAAQYRRRWWDS